jgi:EAL domain-containing protein (putative c-di-GMP-specific phosphodiesterase class I)
MAQSTEEELRDLLPDRSETGKPLHDYADTIHQLLGVVRAQLGMQVAWLSEFVGSEQVMRFVDAAPGATAPREGERLPLSGSFCARVLDGRFPTLIPDARAVPEAGLLDVTAALHIGSYVGVPLVGPQGFAVGMLCAVNDTASPGMSERDVAALRLLASLLREVQDRALTDAQAVDEQAVLRQMLCEVVAGTGRHAVLQPIVEIATGRVVAAEGLTRFTAASPVLGGKPQLRSPAQWFDDAARLGLREELELATAASVLDLLDAVPTGTALTINLGPETLLGAGVHDLLADRPLERIIIELTEHAPVRDYDRLAEALGPYRSAGLRLAVDDAGAGYASLRHVLAVRPDLLKIDMALTRGADVDLARQTLLHALCEFGKATGCRLVAEGIETEQELAAVAGCGVELAQGYYLARPSTEPAWTGYPALV